MKNKIFINIFIVSVSLFLVALTIISVIMYGYLENEFIEDLRYTTDYISISTDKGGTEFLHDLDNDSIRITAVDPSGKVIYDSLENFNQLENHANREEIIEARKTGYGESIRYSKTLDQKTLYCAQLTESGIVVRVSKAHLTIFSLIKSIIIPLIAMIIVCVLLSLIIASRMAKSITRPINQINFENPDSNAFYPELQPLIDKIIEQNTQIKNQIIEIRTEHEKQDTLRREFTANVSHELKTPLTSISGYAEIIKSGIAKEQDLQVFAGRIYDEAQRLIILVGDIIRLSQLDSIEGGAEHVPVNLYEICEATLLHIEPIAKKQDITVTLSGSHQTVYGSTRVIDEIVFNLCDNAVKYNMPGGKVDISIKRRKNGVELSVSDSGIGIPQEDIDRIFERFYRVDKSHSKEVGGTGLGLSIVKHGVAQLGAEIKIKSKLGEGTTITVIFPKK